MFQLDGSLLVFISLLRFPLPIYRLLFILLVEVFLLNDMVQAKSSTKLSSFLKDIKVILSKGLRH